jgi:cyclase
VIFGDDAALVVDAGINLSVGRRIQALIRELTDRPLRYLANTTYRGDHTFGNGAFPADVRIVSSRADALSMTDLAKEKRTRSRNMHGDIAALAEVTQWRLPDLIFEHFPGIDLGDLEVQLWSFGPGNGPGDTIVYIPSVRAAWTGNSLRPCTGASVHLRPIERGCEPGGMASSSSGRACGSLGRR